MHVTPQHLTGRFVHKDTPFRIIAAYGLQETRSPDDREEFFDHLCAEIENCELHNDNPIIVGDLNAKINLVKVVPPPDPNGHVPMPVTEIQPLSSNGKLLHEVIEKYSLQVLNFHPECTGKWTRVEVKNNVEQKSVLDYAITNNLLHSRVESVHIDEERLITPFRIGCKNKVTHTDHNTILSKLSWVPMPTDLTSSKTGESPVRPSSLGWKLSPEGLTNFRKQTSGTMPNSPNNYTELEAIIKLTMDNCFQRRRAPMKQKPANHLLHHKSLLKIFNTIFKPLLSAGRLEKAISKEYISFLQSIQLNEVQEQRAVRLTKTLRNLQNDNQELSVNNFWKLKKSVSRNSDNKTSVITDHEVELFDDASIINEYVREFQTRLSHRKIDNDLISYQESVNKLLYACLDLAQMGPKTDFTETEVGTVFRAFHSGKSPGEDLIPPEVLLNAGPSLIQATTNVLNHIKNNLEIPDSWIKVIIVTLYKNKGSRKKLKYYRGIFLTAVLSKVMEKLIKMRTEEKMKGISSFQFGARHNRGPPDSLFILRSLIDHAMYLRSPLFLTLYDYSTCFDSLWLEDTMLAMWDLGVNDELFPLIFKLNEACSITIRTPYGITPSFSCPRIVKQGCVLSTSLCGSSTGQLCNELDQLECGASVLDAHVKTVLFVDDTATANTDVDGTIRSHKQVLSFKRRKRLELNIPKCVVLPFNIKKNDPLPFLQINNEDVNISHSTKHLGDIISTTGSNNLLINDRTKKGKGIIISALSICNDITLGHFYIKAVLFVYKPIFLSTVLFNSQAWSNITTTQLLQLQTVQLKYFKRTMQVPNSCPNAFTFLELGILPIKYEIHKRQLMFLHHLVNLPPDQPMFQILQRQKQLLFEKNWYNNIVLLLNRYSLNEMELSVISKSKWKAIVYTAVSAHAFDELRAECRGKTKTFSLRYNKFKCQDYVKVWKAFDARLMFRIRSKTINCRNNHHSGHEDITCRRCKTSIETQSHIINCPEITYDDDQHIISLQHCLSDDPSKFNVDLLPIVRRRLDKFYETIVGDGGAV